MATPRRDGTTDVRSLRKAVGARWSAFWFEARFATLPLAICRLAIATVLIAFAVHQRRAFVGLPADRGFGDVFHLAYAGFVPALSYRATAMAYTLAAGCGALALVGLLVRPALVAASALLTLTLLQDRLGFLNHQHHLAVVTFVLAFVPCAERLSLRSWWLRRRPHAPTPPQVVTSWAARLLQVMTSLVFLASALSKAKASWWSGDLMIASQMANADVGVRGGVRALPGFGMSHRPWIIAARLAARLAG
ncbi:MAG TPA: HTTM domain-containing protein [Polyangia bacterium]|jgi:hypothetical protein